MKRIMVAVVLMAMVLLSGCVVGNSRQVEIDDMEGHQHDRLYEFKVYSGGVLIFHEAVYDYYRCTNGDYMLWRTKEDLDNNKGMVVKGDIVANDVAPEQAYLVSLQPTPAPTPKKEATNDNF
jgi:hypothetical protein